MSNYDSVQHVRGESLFVDDLCAPEGLLYTCLLYTSEAETVGAVRIPLDRNA